MNLKSAAVVPTRGGGTRLSRCLESLLAQAVPLQELVVMLDGETEVEFDLPHDPRVRLRASSGQT